MQIYHAQRLKKLAIYLETLPKDSFDLDTWCTLYSDDTQSFEELQNSEIVHYTKHSEGVQVFNTHINCGSTACALGWAASIPEFIDQGLAMFVDVSNLFDTESESEYDDTERHYLDGEVVYQDGDGHTWIGVKAGMKFFGITEGEAHNLFIPENYFDDEDEDEDDHDWSERDEQKITDVAPVIERINQLLVKYGYQYLVK